MLSQRSLPRRYGTGPYVTDGVVYMPLKHLYRRCTYFHTQRTQGKKYLKHQVIMSQQTIVSKGIYHGLPTFPDDLNGLTALVAGANGISGDYMVGAGIEIVKRLSNHPI